MFLARHTHRRTASTPRMKTKRDDGWYSGVVHVPHRPEITRTNAKKKRCLDRGSNTGPLDLQSNALPTELSKQLYGGDRPTLT
jgi:hypothetical protein